ncbi:hypothetical protein ACQ4LE_001448, partial [Meloidogyne hapla]
MFWINGFAGLLWFSLSSSIVNSSNSSEVQVGFGNHTLKEGKVTLMNGVKIVEGNDITNLKKFLPACVASLDRDFIYVDYNEQSEEVCTVDLLTESDSIIFNAQLRLCDKNKTKDLDGYNILPFAYSLSNEEINMIKYGPLFGKSNADCPEEGGCKLSWNKSGDWNGIITPNCMPWTALEVEWLCKDISVLAATVYFIGEIGFVTTGSIQLSNLTTQVRFTVQIDKNGHVESKDLAMLEGGNWPTKSNTLHNGIYFKCIYNTSIIQPKAWEIVNNEAKEFNGKKLMTFHLLPKSASRARNGTELTGKFPGFVAGKYCRNMSIVFSRTDYKLLMMELPTIKNISTPTTTADLTTQPTTIQESENAQTETLPTTISTPTSSSTDTSPSTTDISTMTIRLSKLSTSPSTSTASSPKSSSDTSSRPAETISTMKQEQQSDSKSKPSSLEQATVHTTIGGISLTEEDGSLPLTNSSNLDQNFTTISSNETFMNVTNETIADNITITYSTSMPTIILSPTTTKIFGSTNGTTKVIILKGTQKGEFPLHYYYIIFGGIVVIVLLLFVIICVCCIIRKNKKKDSIKEESSEGSGGTTEELLSIEAKKEQSKWMLDTKMDTQDSHISEKKTEKKVIVKKEIIKEGGNEPNKKEIS